MTNTDVTVLGVIITVIGVVYNIPFAWRVWRTWSAGDIDPYFLALRILNSVLTISYGALLKDQYIIITNAVPLFTSIFVLSVRCHEFCKSRYIKKAKQTSQSALEENAHYSDDDEKVMMLNTPEVAPIPPARQYNPVQTNPLPVSNTNRDD